MSAKEFIIEFCFVLLLRVRHSFIHSTLRSLPPSLTHPLVNNNLVVENDEEIYDARPWEWRAFNANRKLQVKTTTIRYTKWVISFIHPVLMPCSAELYCVDSCSSGTISRAPFIVWVMSVIYYFCPPGPPARGTVIKRAVVGGWTPPKWYEQY